MFRTSNGSVGDRMDKKVFIHSSGAFPHGGAQANYVQYLGLICKEAGYTPVMIVRPNVEYINMCSATSYMGMKVIPIVASKKEEIHVLQREDGFSKERIHAMVEAGITSGDIVITFHLGYNRKFHCNIQEFCRKVGAKSIVGVLEYFGAEDFTLVEQYENFRITADEIYLKYDGILVVSEKVAKFYKRIGKKTFCFPPFMDCGQCEVTDKKNDRYHFLISSEKDSIKSMLMAFVGLEDDELNKIQVHLCGIKENYIKEILESSDWERIAKWIMIHPWMRYDELTRLYGQMHFLLIARKKCQRTLSNFPSKVPETMAFKVVPVVSDVGDYTNNYLTDGKDSIFIVGDSVEEIRKAVRKTIAMTVQEYACYSQNAFQTAKKRFDYHVWIPEIKRMLESV